MRACGVFFVLATTACASAPSAMAITQSQWDVGRARLEVIRASFPKSAFTRPVSVEFYEPITRRRFTGRGAVGVDPGHAMRMILVGPAGAPALDVWVTRDAWRFAVPAINLERRGGAESPPSLPIGFFRAWFVDPLAGRLLSLGTDDELVVRDVAGGTLHINGDAAHAHVRRRQGTQTETFTYAIDGAGERATYLQASTGLAISITAGAIGAEPPDPLAFIDPDRAGSR